MSTMIMEKLGGLFGLSASSQIQGLMRLSGRKLQIHSSLRPEVLYEDVTQPLRCRNRALKDLPSFLFHRDSMPEGSSLKPIVGLIVKLADAQTCHEAPPVNQQG